MVDGDTGEETGPGLAEDQAEDQAESVTKLKIDREMMLERHGQQRGKYFPAAAPLISGAEQLRGFSGRCQADAADVLAFWGVVASLKHTKCEFSGEGLDRIALPPANRFFMAALSKADT